MERIASPARIFDPDPRISSIESTFPLRAITKSRVSSPWIPAVAASYGYCHTSSIFRLIDAKYEMYWTSGAFNGVSRNPPPPSSVIPTFPVLALPAASGRLVERHHHLSEGRREVLQRLRRCGSR